jgi:hypothetical protein
MSDRLNYNTLAPAAMKALGGVHVYLHSHADLPKNLIDLAYLRTSQINGVPIVSIVRIRRAPSCLTRGISRSV